jgi:glycosyltransferase involved in cell wall biosynthesis
MNVLFVHNNFPAQFLHIAQALIQDPEIKVAAIGSPTARPLLGMQLLKYDMGRLDVSATHPFARRFDVECHRAEQVLYCLSSLKASGFLPDVIVSHPGWGESLPLRAVFPAAHIIAYCEFYYGLNGRDVRFDPEFPAMGTDGDVLVQIKNAASLLALSDCDLGISPTDWQKSTFPREYLNKIEVVHEGINVDVAVPNPNAEFTLPNGRKVTIQDEVVTYVTRNMEPLRGCHIFFRSLPRILAKRPNAQVIIVGGDGTSYGAPAPNGKTWKSIFFDEIKNDIDVSRVHFTGTLPYDQYLKVLQISAVHIYLTYPFVTSWSLVEALSAGCLVIGSDTAPVREVIDGTNGILVPFFDKDLLAQRVIEVLADRPKYAALRVKARETVLERFDMMRLCMPRLRQLIIGRSEQSASNLAEPAKPPRKVARSIARAVKRTPK